MKKFLFVDANGDATEGIVDGIIETRPCDPSLTMMEPVMESDNITGGVEQTTNNTDVRDVIGWAIDKPTVDTVNVLLAGKIDTPSNLVKGQKVYLGADGRLATVKPAEGYLKVLGHAIDDARMDFNPVNTKLKIYKMMAPFTYIGFETTMNDNRSGFGLSDDGTKYYYRSLTNIEEYDLSTPFDLSSRGAVVNQIDDGLIDTQSFGNPLAFMVSPDGSLFTMGVDHQDGNYGAIQFNMTTPFSLSGMTFRGRVNVPDNKNIFSAQFVDSGNKLVMADSEKNIHVYDLGTPYDITTAGAPTSTYINITPAGAFDQLEGFYMQPDGSRMLVIPRDTYEIYSYKLTTPYDVSSFTDEGVLDVDVYNPNALLTREGYQFINGELWLQVYDPDIADRYSRIVKYSQP